jgi:hypothetical protein
MSAIARLARTVPTGLPIGNEAGTQIDAVGPSMRACVSVAINGRTFGVARWRGRDLHPSTQRCRRCTTNPPPG